MSLGLKPPRKLAIRPFASEVEDVVTSSVAFLPLISLLRASAGLGSPVITPLLVLPPQDIAAHKVAAMQSVNLTLS